MAKGVLTVISGFSGAGKGTVTKGLISKYPEHKLSVSATSRAQRQWEVDGKDYLFLTRDQFESMIKEGDFIEWTEYVGNYYGTPKSYVNKQLEEGKDVILEIEVQGALNVKKIFPEAVLIFLAPPSFKELEVRLTGRGTEDADTVKKRLLQACDEAQYIYNYKYYVINYQVDECIEHIRSIIANEHSYVSNNRDKIDSIYNEIDLFKKGEL